jgi:microcystin-dependent protein
MPTPIIFTLTNAGLNAALDADANGLTLSLTQIGIGSGKYTPAATRTALQTEIARYPLSGGDVESNSKTLRFSAILESVTTQQAFEVGLFTSTGVLFAVASTTGTDPLILVTANIAFVGSFGLVVSEIPPGSVTVVTDPNAALAVVLMAQHIAAGNPHPQYTLLTQFLAAIQSIQERLSIVEMTFIVNFINQQLVPRLQGLLSYQGQIEYVGVAMTAAQFTAAKADGSVWEVYAEGRTIVGSGSVTIDYSSAAGEAARPNQSQTFLVGQTGGELTHKQTTTELRQHDHSEAPYNKFVSSIADADAAGDLTDANGNGNIVPAAAVTASFDATYIQVADISGAQFEKMTEKSVGESVPFNVMQPYIVANCFICVTPASEIQPLAFPTP